MNALDSHYARYDADVGNWPQPQDTCNACHGTSEKSQNEQYPSLVGQKADYLQAQLHAFAEGKRHSAQMEPLAATLTDDQIVFLAQYFARQTPLSTDISTADEQLSAKGKVSAAERGCSACHGSDFVGGAVGPRLAGQGKAYLLSQLLAFKEGTQTDPSGAMNATAGLLSQTEAQALAHYLADLDPARH
ncbi:c-type cytochrome [Pseudomonas juntendi]|uniref:c-type cytochrome n=1 Tax=Pseudomonas juntendi TaxID=2666183 RepID=UPI001F492889|nr:c-type cytochrome [Pseudomonas juntendi]MCO7055700.1 c-type cytochrome [Pseudomonas juntendi]UJM14994.1 c-type cytochrome [Pseudomonas juntendi]UXA41130.1 c-type cytochrome [Pseudomonas juntendi]